MKMPIETIPWDVTEHLDSEEAIAAFLDAIFEEGDPRLMAAAIGDVARARGMSEIAERTGLSRESLYRALSREGNPEMATIVKVMRALGMRVSVSPGAQVTAKAV